MPPALQTCTADPPAPWPRLQPSVWWRPNSRAESGGLVLLDPTGQAGPSSIRAKHVLFRWTLHGWRQRGQPCRQEALCRGTEGEAESRPSRAEHVARGTEGSPGVSCLEALLSCLLSSRPLVSSRHEPCVNKGALPCLGGGTGARGGVAVPMGCSCCSCSYYSVAVPMGCSRCTRSRPQARRAASDGRGTLDSTLDGAE
jgi:hypothetical protein